MTKLKCAPVALTRLSLAATGAILSFPLMARPSPGLEVWEQLLGVQLVEEQRCVLAGTLFVREMPTREGVTLSGRARCFDGRQFVERGLQALPVEPWQLPYGHQRRDAVP